MARINVSVKSVAPVGRYRFDTHAVLEHFGVQNDPQKLNELLTQFGLPQVSLPSLRTYGVGPVMAQLVELSYRMDRPLDMQHVLIQDR